MPISKKQINKGFHGFKDDSAEFLKAKTNPWEQTVSGVGYNGTRDDNEGYSRGVGAYAADDEAFRSPSWTGDSDVATDIYDVVTGVTGPGGEMVTGGGPLPRTRKSRRDGSK